MEFYTVPCFGRTLYTVVTSDPMVVHSWIVNTVSRYKRQSQELVVGLDIEWRPNTEKGSDNPVATLQLCVGVHCLVLQILQADAIPTTLFDFLAHPRHIFVGVGVAEDAEKLHKDCNLVVNRVVDLRSLAAKVFGKPNLKWLGLKALASRVLNLQMEKPLHVTMSDWDCDHLSREQIHYAAIDAFVSSEIARKLRPQYPVLVPCLVPVHYIHPRVPRLVQPANAFPLFDPSVLNACQVPVFDSSSK